MKNRREFLKKGALASIGVATLGSTLGLMNTAKAEENNEVIKGQSKKKEVLFKRSQNWKLYYEKAE